MLQIGIQYKTYGVPDTTNTLESCHLANVGTHVTGQTTLQFPLVVSRKHHYASDRNPIQNLRGPGHHKHLGELSPSQRWNSCNWTNHSPVPSCRFSKTSLCF